VAVLDDDASEYPDIAFGDDTDSVHIWHDALLP